MTREWAVLAEGRVILHLGLEVHQRVSGFVAIAGMHEGMVLRRDVLNGSGGMLLRSGTSLTESHLAQLSRVLGATTRLEVAAPLEGVRP